MGADGRDLCGQCRPSTNGRAGIRLVTIEGTIPDAVGAAAMRGQWESCRIVTEGNPVWLAGANPLSDLAYVWTGYRSEHHDPLVLKRTRFAQNPPAFLGL